MGALHCVPGSVDLPDKRARSTQQTGVGGQPPRVSHPRRASTAETSGTNNGCGSAGRHWTPDFPVRQATHCYTYQSAPEVKMSSAEASSNTSTEMPEAGTIDMKLEVVTLPVSDVDRAKRFYQSLGWRLDADIAVGDAFRVVQLTPTHSACSIAFG